MTERSRTLLAGVTIWAAATLVETSIVVAQEGVPLSGGLVSAGFSYAILGFLAIGVWRLCGWSLTTERHRAAVITVHVALFLVGVSLWQSICLGILYLVAGPVALSPVEFGGLWYLLGAATTYALMVAAILATRLSQHLRRQKEREAELTILAREAEIRALRAQLRPHFLFNVLNSIYSLVESRPPQAKKMIDLLGRLMRQTLEVANEQMVPLEWELDCARTYLDIESVRLGERMRVKITVDDDLLGFSVPPLILQPLVDNAVKHGIASCAAPGWIEIEAQRNGPDARLVVRDSGPGTKDYVSGNGTKRGLELTRTRLARMYGDRAVLELRNRQPRGFEAEILLPHA